MKIVIIAVGKEKEFAGHDLVAEYVGRIGHYAPCEWRYLSSGDQKEEHGRIMEALDKESKGGGAYIVALDEIGKELDSRSFADRLQACMNESVRSLIFIIGGAYGLNDEIRKRSSLTFALSRLTFPHRIVRLILAEQIYRAFSIIRGEKYHH